MTVTRFKNDPSAAEWKLCEKCEIVVAPRTWHCSTCNVCILKRDHHCIFAGTCVGLFNHRYFAVFLFYFFIGALYCLIYNSYYIWIFKCDHFLNWLTPLKMGFPMFMILFRTLDEIHLLLYMLILFGALFSGALIIFHCRLIRTNTLTHEKNKGAYDQGIRKNLKIVFGDSMLYNFMWPFSKSKLPEVYWDVAESVKSK
jgi:palmitoyltransferase